MKKIKSLSCLILFIATINVGIARDYRDNIFDKFETQDFKQYFSNETCYEFEHNKKKQRLDKLKNTYLEQKYNHLIESESRNKQILYRLIAKKCKNQFLNPKLLKYSKFEMIVNISPKTEIEELASQLYCDRKHDKNCPYKINNNEYDTILHSKDYYIHEIFRYSMDIYLRNVLSKKVAKHLNTGNTTLAYYILKDAYVLYQCEIGKDCSSTSPFMVEKCLIDDEFCGIDVKTYFSTYKHSLSQSKDIKKVVEFLELY